MARTTAAANRESVHLLDGNALVALVSPSHVHHAAAQAWFVSGDVPFATCPITQGTLLRILMNLGALNGSAAMAVLRQLTGHSRHRFWPDAIGYGEVAWHGVVGHRQVTDAYLAGLARHHGGRLLTLDHGLATLHSDVAVALAGV